MCGGVRRVLIGLTECGGWFIIYLYERKKCKNTRSDIGGAEEKADAVWKKGMAYFFYRVFRRLALDDLGDTYRTADGIKEYGVF